MGIYTPILDGQWSWKFMPLIPQAISKTATSADKALAPAKQGRPSDEELPFWVVIGVLQFCPQIGKRGGWYNNRAADPS